MRSLPTKKTLSSWWATRWLELVQNYRPREFMPFFAGFQFGQSGYAEARSGRVLEPRIEGGKAEAILASNNGRFFSAPEIEVAPLPDKAWESAIAALAARAQFLAELLSHRMPIAISSVFQKTRSDLFPIGKGELSARCTCTMKAIMPCLHVQALHYTLGDAMERDPLVLFELRGMPREKLLAAIHQQRRASRAPSPQGRLALAAESYELLADRLPEAAAPPALPDETAGSLRGLPQPAGWTEAITPADLLAPVFDAAARQARQMLLDPGKIRSLAPIVTPGLPRARGLLDFPGKPLALQALECLALGQHASRGEDPDAALAEFSSRLARKTLKVADWRKSWIPDILRGQDRIQLSWESLELAEGVFTTALLALHPTGATALSWASLPGDASPQDRRKAGRALLAELDGLVPGDAAIELVTRREEGGDSLESYLDILGWDHVLLGQRRAQASSPALLPLQTRHGQGSRSFEVPGPGAAPEPLEGISPTSLDRMLWLRVLARGILGELGQAAIEPAQEPVEQGLLGLEGLAAMQDAEAIGWLQKGAGRLALRPWWTRLFRAGKGKR